MGYIITRLPGIKQLYSLYMDMIRRNKLKGLNTESVFTNIFTNNEWGDNNSVSGPGSNLLQTKVVRKEIKKLLRILRISTILDIPCGDFYWMKSVDLNSVQYIGADIVKSIIQQNIIKYSSKNINFKQLNLITDDLPKVDLIICRDCLVHFSSKDVLLALKNISRSNSTYLLSTFFTNSKKNKEIITGEWEPINLTVDPFNLPIPKIIINEKYLGLKGKYKDKSLGLWKIENISA